MFFEVGRKKVGPIILGDEIEVRYRGRMDRSQKGVFPRVADGGGGKSRNKIGVIRSGSHEIFFGQIAIKISNSIDDGRIALKGNLLS
jgi:hypothetical protein